ncbi:unnamed protein product [Rangifer tarandus platyrhynchus]|uniref:Uncharacterized protein n=1 Tax=Rangifer tarandus platyrhynchus TaxID=3082113 RepID=A0AC59ZRV2_RANTA
MAWPWHWHHMPREREPGPPWLRCQAYRPRSWLWVLKWPVNWLPPLLAVVWEPLEHVATTKAVTEEGNEVGGEEGRRHWTPTLGSKGAPGTHVADGA